MYLFYVLGSGKMIHDTIASRLADHAPGELPLDALETPQDRTMGDLALPCFGLAKQLQKSPVAIAQDLAAQLQPLISDDAPLERIVATGPYLNIFIRPARRARQLLPGIKKQKHSYGRSDSHDEALVIESPGPNTNKPLHLGHVRNMLLGNSLAQIAMAAGFDVQKVDIVNDRGVHICKSMLAYDRRGEDDEPDKKTDHYVGDRYVRYAQEAKKDPSLEIEVQTMLQQREAGDAQVRALRQKMRDRSIDGMQATYARYGCTIDKTYYESQHYLQGKAIVEQGLQDDVFHRDTSGNIVYEDDTCGSKVVLRADGTSIYMTQDIALGKLRYEDWKMDRMVYVVGNEQEHHFQCLFTIFAALGLPFAEQCHHLSYGMIRLPDGKMKSREGNVVDADTLADEMHAMSYELLIERHPQEDEQLLHEKAEIIALGAIKFFILLYDAKKDFVFDQEASLRFDGESGPYIQYTYARCMSVLAKGSAGAHEDAIEYELLTTDEERILLVLLSEYVDTLRRAAEQYQPYLVARYVLELARAFNSYYHSITIIQDDAPATQAARLMLVATVAQILRNGLALLGIEVLEQM